MAERLVLALYCCHGGIVGLCLVCVGREIALARAAAREAREAIQAIEAIHAIEGGCSSILSTQLHCSPVMTVESGDVDSQLGEKFHDSENELSPTNANQGKLKGGFKPIGHLSL